MQKIATIKKGFSLIELSIVILIVSILITGSLGVSKTAINNSRVRVTRDRMDVAYKAIANFVAANKRLPCPASIATAKGNPTYGDETAAPTCTGSILSGTLAYGMVPLKALGLDLDMAEDGFGTKISYVVDTRFTKRINLLTDNDGFEGTKSALAVDKTGDTLASIIQIQQSISGVGSDISPYSVIALISHGANKFNGFNATATSINGVSTLADENSNSSVGSYDKVFVSYSNNPNFDDMMLFKTKTEIARDAGMEFMICSGGEAEDTSPGGAKNPTTWTYDAAQYGNSPVNSSNNCITGVTSNPLGSTKSNKICGRYGIWSASSPSYDNCL